MRCAARAGHGTAPHLDVLAVESSHCCNRKPKYENPPMHVVTMNAFWFVVKGTPMNEPDMAQRKRGKRRRSGGRDAANAPRRLAAPRSFFSCKFCVPLRPGRASAAESRRKRRAHAERRRRDGRRLAGDHRARLVGEFDAFFAEFDSAWWSRTPTRVVHFAETRRNIACTRSVRSSTACCGLDAGMRSDDPLRHTCRTPITRGRRGAFHGHATPAEATRAADGVAVAASTGSPRRAERRRSAMRHDQRTAFPRDRQ